MKKKAPGDKGKIVLVPLLKRTNPRLAEIEEALKKAEIKIRNVTRAHGGGKRATSDAKRVRAA